MEYANEIIASAIGSAIGIITGGVITWLAARRYYRKATKNLTEESSKMMHLNVLTLLALDRAGVVEITRDENGNVAGFKERIKLDSVNETKTFEPPVSDKNDET